MAAAPLATNATEAQAIAYLNANYKNTYTNSVKTPYQGKNASQIYAYLKTQSPSSTPYQIAVATADLLLSSAVGDTIGTAATTAGNVVGDTATGVATASYIPSLTNLLGAFTNKALWIRVVKVVMGGSLVIIGLSHMTGASNSVATAARKVPVIV